MNKLNRLDNSSLVLSFVAKYREESIAINWGGLFLSHHVFQLSRNLVFHASFEKRVVVSWELVFKLLLGFGDVKAQVGRPCRIGCSFFGVR